MPMCAWALKPKDLPGGRGGEKIEPVWVTSRRFVQLSVCLGFQACHSHATQVRVGICFRVELETPPHIPPKIMPMRCLCSSSTNSLPLSPLLLIRNKPIATMSQPLCYTRCFIPHGSFTCHSPMEGMLLESSFC